MRFKSVSVGRSSSKRPDDKSDIKDKILLFKVEGKGVGDTHITGRHLGGDTHITSVMCAGIHISRGNTYHCDTANDPAGKRGMAWILFLGSRFQFLT